MHLHLKLRLLLALELVRALSQTHSIQLLLTVSNTQVLRLDLSLFKVTLWDWIELSCGG